MSISPVLPSSVVLTLVDRWGHTDFALAAVLEITSGLLEHGFTYDVICSYIRHIIDRFKQYHPDQVEIVKRLKMLLPKMHMHAHKNLCQVVYTLCFAAGFGLMHGEGIETIWAELNAAGRTTREMLAGARHDALNALMNYWNWQKIEKMRK